MEWTGARYADKPTVQSVGDSRRGAVRGDDLLGRPAGKTGAGGRRVFRVGVTRV